MNKVLTVSTPPSFEPITLAEAKLHLRVDGNDEDALIVGLIAAARETAETISRRALAVRTYDYVLDAWPIYDTLWLPMPPVQSVTSISCIDYEGQSHTMSTADYYVDTALGRVCLAYSKSWPTYSLRSHMAITVRYVAGFSQGFVPETYKAAIKLLVGYWYANREAAAPDAMKELPLAVKSLLLMDRADVPG